MIRYRAFILFACLAAALAYLGAWRAAGSAPSLSGAGAGLALPSDAAYVALHYADRAVQGDWLRYSPGAELSTGLSSPLHFLLLSALLGLGLNGPLAAWLLGAASLLLAAVALDALSRRLFPRLPPWWAPLLLLSQGAWTGWALGGQEHGLLFALSLGAVLACLDGQRGRFLLALAALAVTRIEGQALAALLALAWPASRPPARAAGLALALAPSVLWLALNGSPLPDAIRREWALSADDAWAQLAQASQRAQRLMNAWMGQADAGAARPVFPLGLLLAATVGLFHLASGQGRALGTALAVAVAVGMAWPSALPAGPLSGLAAMAAAAPLLLLGALGALDLLRGQRGWGRPAAAALVTLWAGAGLARWPGELHDAYAAARDGARAAQSSAEGLRTLPDGGVAAWEPGRLAYRAPRAVLDLQGRCDARLARVQAQGKGALVEALLDLPNPPAWALLPAGPEADAETWQALGLLQAPLPGDWGGGLRAHAWDWQGAALRGRPARDRPGWQALGGLNVAALEEEREAMYRARGPRAGRSRAIRLRLSEDGPLVPEGGREVLVEGFERRGEALLLRAVFAQPGRLLLRAPDGRKLAVVAVDASPSGVYSEALLPLPEDSPARVEIGFEDEKGQPSAWSSCRYWFLGRTAP